MTHRSMKTSGTAGDPRERTLRDRSSSEEMRMFKHVADNAAEGIAVTDIEMRLMYTNRAFDELYGRDHAELIGTNPLQFGLDPDTREAVRVDIERSFDDHDSWSDEITIERPDGTTVPALVSASVLTDDDGKPVGRVAMLTDLSEVKWAEARLREVNAALDAYAQTVSHDLRGPLAAVVMANEMMREAVESDDIAHLRAEVVESTGSIARNLDRAYGLINDLLSLAESGQEQLEATEVDITGVVELVLEEHSAEIAARGIEVRCADDLGTVRASETHMFQLFSNLMSNGIRHNDCPTPVLTLDYAKIDGGMHRYLMTDNSSGISQDEMSGIFKPLYRGPFGSGKGIGLAIVKRIVDVYGGTLRIYNDNGACFEFDLKDVRD